MLNEEVDGFQLLDDGFIHEGNRYFDHQITNISFIRQYSGAKMVCGPVISENFKAFLNIYADGKRINVAERVGFIKSAKKEVADYIEKIYIAISYRTAKSRLSRYVSSLEAKGYIYYNGWKLYPDKKIFVNDNKVYELNDYHLFKTEYSIDMRKKGSTNNVFLKLLKDEVGIGKDIVFSTALDRDLIFPIMKHYFQLDFK